MVGFSSHFTSAVVLVSTKTDPHKDQANIIPVTCFENGGLWVERAGGATFRVVGTKRVPGVVLNFNGKPLTIDAKNNLATASLYLPTHFGMPLRYDRRMPVSLKIWGS